MANPTLIRYNASELATFPISSTYYSCTSEEDEHESLVFRAGGNVEQRASWNSTIRREWTLDFPALTLAQKNTLQTFFETHKGILIPFKWMNDGSLYFVRFSSSKILYEQIFYRIWKVRCNLRQIGSHEINTEA